MNTHNTHVKVKKPRMNNKFYQRPTNKEYNE